MTRFWRYVRRQLFLQAVARTDTGGHRLGVEGEEQNMSNIRLFGEFSPPHFGYAGHRDEYAELGYKICRSHPSQMKEKIQSVVKYKVWYCWNTISSK